MRKRVEFAKFFVELCLLRSIFQLWHFSQVHIHGVESIDGDRVIRIRIHPRPRNCGVVDGQNLQRLLFSRHCPVHHFLQISKVAHTLTTFAAEREDRNGSTCHTWVNVGEIKFYFRCKKVHTFSEFRHHQEAIVATFPFFHLAIAVYRHKFVVIGFSKLLRIECQLPVVGCHFFKSDSPCGLPCTQSLPFSHDSEFQSALTECGTKHTQRVGRFSQRSCSWMFLSEIS